MCSNGQSAIGYWLHLFQMQNESCTVLSAGIELERGKHLTFSPYKFIIYRALSEVIKKLPVKEKASLSKCLHVRVQSSCNG